jgi:hypothetical protein
MFSAQKKTHRRSSSSGEPKKFALSLDIKSKRSPAIDLRTIDDVPTAACVELSRAILKRPELQTGSFFKLVAAANNEVNKSDAVIVIVAAVLGAVGNEKASKRMLDKSSTVAEFYERLNLTDNRVRDSVVIMLFALAPEFVKMIESSLKTVIERVQVMTTAPHADRKLLDATGELAKDGSVSPEEHSRMLEDLAAVDINKERVVAESSIQTTPVDGITADDSISRVGKEAVYLDTSPVDTRGILRYIKRNKTIATKDFYDEFPSARRPVAAAANSGRKGLGFPMAESAVSEPVSESNFSVVMNTLMRNPAVKKSRTAVDSIHPFRRNPVGFVKSTYTDGYDTALERQLDAECDMMTNAEVTREDIEEKKMEQGNTFAVGSPVISAAELDEEMKDLLSNF